MAAPISSSKLFRPDRKINTKVYRSKQLLLKHEHIEITTVPTNLLCVYNGSLELEVCQEKVNDLFCPYGTIQEIVMIPKKPFCFVCYASKHEAEEACNSLVGHTIIPGDNENHLYIFYVGKVPPVVGPTSTLPPPGSTIIPDFISKEEEISLLQSINWQNEADHALSHRKVNHYGYEFKYGINNVDSNCPLVDKIPSICDSLLTKAKEMGVVNYIPDQLTVNQYDSGQGISPYVNDIQAFEDGIMCLSLGSQVVMEFKHPNGDHLSVLLPARSLLVMTGESRYVWSHGISARKCDIIPASDGNVKISQRGIQTSFTFRKLIEPDGKTSKNLSSVSSYESQQIHCLPETAEQAITLEQQHVHQVYNDIADHFSSTRHSPWPQIVDFVNAQPLGSIMADIGCGNGKYLGVNSSLYSVGSDRSVNLAKICQERNYEALVSDVMCIPLRSNCIDICICIAVIHHLSTKERRLESIKELIRILRSGGQVLIYVWALEQQRHKVKSKYIQKKTKTEKTVDAIEIKEPAQNNFSKTPSTHNAKSSSNCDINNIDVIPIGGQTSNKNIHVHVNRTEFQEQDMFVPWQLKNKSLQKNVQNSSTYHRFYHVFREGELEDLCSQIPDGNIIKSYYDQGNWCIILQKL